ncbi:MAG: hypothetical protein Q4B30_00885 [Coriobacteriaceae bacterium]|nr:hypothetical protein [Coriobacteriaceae bacterium]
MAKDVYKIPDTLDKSMGDMQISLQSADGVGVKPMPIKIILMWVCSAILWFLCVAKTFIGSGGIAAIVIFTALWFGMTALLLARDKTGVPQAALVVSMLNYLPKSMRYAITRNNAPAKDFYQIAGIEDIDGEKGLITFSDGTYGYMYRVVGTGSVLLFDEDRKAILDRVDSFYRKMKPEYEMIFITSKEAQKVYRQVAAMKRRYDSLAPDDDELRALADTEYRVLKNYVGGSFRSIHQYLILKADNAEALIVAKNMLQSEVENSTMMFKQCTALFGDDIYEVLRTIYKGKESV